VIRPVLAPIPVSTSPDCSAVVAGIMLSKIFIHPESGRICGGMTRRLPRHSS
jgi:hypothetical protein